MPGDSRTVTKPPIQIHERVKPVTDCHATIDMKALSETFLPTLHGLILNVSYEGCAICVLDPAGSLVIGSECRVKLGNKSPMRAQVRWKKAIDAELAKVGLLLLE